MSSKAEFDAIVVGGGMAGVATTARLGELGLKTALIDKQKRPPEKSLFINGENHIPQPLLDTLSRKQELIPCPNLEIVHLDRADSDVKATPGRGFTYAVFHPPIIREYEERFGANVHRISGNVVAATEEENGTSVVLQGGETIRGGILVDATGNYSQLSRIYQTSGNKAVLKDDPYVLWVKGVRAYGDFEPGKLVMPLGREVGLSWILPYTNNYGDIITSDYMRLSELDPKKQNAMLARLILLAKEKGWANIKSIEGKFSSFIRSEPIPQSATKTKWLYAVGESAGMGSPLMAEVVPAALLWGEKLADAVASGRSPHQFYTQWRKKEQLFPYDLEMGMLDARVKRERKGVYGASAELYRKAIELLPEEAQHEVLRTRKLPVKYIPRTIRAMIGNPILARIFFDMGVGLAKVKVRNMMQRN